MQRIWAWVLGCAFCAASLTSRVAHADEPVEPLRYDVAGQPDASTSARTALAGLAVTTLWYGAALGSSYVFPDSPGSASLRVPVAGPWMALAKTGCADDEPDCSTFNTVVRAVLTTANGVAQAGGLLVASESLFLEAAPPKQGASITSVDAQPLRHGWILSVMGEF